MNGDRQPSRRADVWLWAMTPAHLTACAFDGIVALTTWSFEESKAIEMPGKFSELRGAMPAADQQRALATFTEMTEEMPCHALRRARGLSQKMLADVLHIGQPAVARMERSTDLYLSTLRTHIEAMGGVLEIVAKFPEGSVTINDFQALNTAEPAAETEVD